MLAFGKLRLCLVGSRLHFPSENRQSRAKLSFALRTGDANLTQSVKYVDMFGMSKTSPCGRFLLIHHKIYRL